MQDQNTNQNQNKITTGFPGLDAFLKNYSEAGSVNHLYKHTNNQSEIKEATVERYKRSYDVTYIMKDGKVELQTVNGIDDLEDTFNEYFLICIEDKIADAERSKDDNDDEYDDYFQNKD